MNFKLATDSLCSPVSHSDLAAAMGVSVALIRQARLKETANAYRRPPAGWERNVSALAKTKIREYQNLIDTLERS